MTHLLHGMMMKKKAYEDLLERDPSMVGKTFDEIMEVYPELKANWALLQYY